MIDNRDAQAIDAAKLYYEHGLSQTEVAAQLGISRPTVSKLLQLARDKGYVTITIHDPREWEDHAIAQLKETFGLHEVRVVRPVLRTVVGRSPEGSAATPANNHDDLLDELGQSAAGLLEKLVWDGISIGISWGNTMYAIAKHLRTTPLKNAKIVQLKGGHSHSERSTHDIDTLTRFARAFDAEALILPLPVILDSKETKDLVIQDRHIASILDAGKRTDVAVFTVGSVGQQSLLVNLGMLAPEEEKDIINRAVGDVCSRFYTSTGKVASPVVDERTVSITLKDLRSRPIRLMVAGGIAKAEAIRVALDMGLATHLVIDHETALRVLGS